MVLDGLVRCPSREGSRGLLGDDRRGIDDPVLWRRRPCVYRTASPLYGSLACRSFSAFAANDGTARGSRQVVGTGPSTKRDSGCYLLTMRLYGPGVARPC